LTQAADRRSRWLAFIGIAAVIVIVDQISKVWLRSTMRPGEPPVEVIGEFVRFVHGQNRGGIFGLFGDSALILGLASLFVIALIIVYQAREGVRSWLLTVALGLLLGGAIGNLIDRLTLGHVTDWVDMGIGSWRWYTFNVADAAISFALVILIAIALLGERLTSRFERSTAR
jgi:signal peptidase II